MIAASKFNQKMYCPSVVVDVFASACCDLDLWPSESNQMASEYSLSVSSRLLKTFIRYRGNKIRLDKQTDKMK